MGIIFYNRYGWPFKLLYHNEPSQPYRSLSQTPHARHSSFNIQIPNSNLLALTSIRWLLARPLRLSILSSLLHLAHQGSQERGVHVRIVSSRLSLRLTLGGPARWRWRGDRQRPL